MSVPLTFEVLNRQVVACRKCPRLAGYRERVAREKRRMYRGQEYWGRPVPGFGDPEAELLVLGLAPAAHGGNRTGRVFTGDRSGDFLFAALHRAGFANQAESRSRDDGLRLKNCYITASVRCCPPANKPTREEQANCRPYLEAELRLLTRLRAVLALGRLAHETLLRLLRDYGQIESLAHYPFAHGASYELPAAGAAGLGERGTARRIRLFDSYHPSPQNTQTGRLTEAMFDRVLRSVNRHLQS
ncbi:MAG: uracil-DNA glycosylase [Candidatus Acidiferrales bacterium]